MCDVTGLLKEGTWSFKDDKAEENKEVTYSGYGLNQDKNTSSDYGENAYVLVNSTVISRATIRQVQQNNEKIKITAPTTESKNYEYGIELGDVKLTGGAVQYQKDDENWLSVDGTWIGKIRLIKKGNRQQEQTRLQQPLHRMRSTMTDMELLRQKYLFTIQKSKSIGSDNKPGSDL